MFRNYIYIFIYICIRVLTRIKMYLKLTRT